MDADSSRLNLPKRSGRSFSVKRLNDAITLYIEVNNEDPKPLVWTKTADEILASIARFCKRTSGAGH